MEKFWKFIKDEDGLETAEYAVMGALVLLVVVAAIWALRDSISNAFYAVSQTIDGGIGGGGS